MRITKNIRNFSLVLIAAAIAGCQGAAQQEPAAEPVTVAPVAKAVTSDKNYQVTRGDNLWAISGKAEIYANPYQWPLIYKKNTDKIKDADLIYPGQVLAVDGNPAAAEVGAAVQHAKTRGRWSIGVVEESDKAYLRR